ncbi:hypothetical protein COO92_16115 [Thalassospira lohafexi]|uniref:Uncharacterized protein n=2 Tax=Thalassospira lohafexi TaxID=744227 RepID=A0A2N3L3T0_9PROT|nr:hypothetical protein COO92_16115 [Thalassospira lohafexi]
MMGCESQDRLTQTRFIALSDTEFVYDAVVIHGYSDEDRTRWLNDEVTKYGMCTNGFDIIDKRRVETVGSWLGSAEREITRGKCKEG